MTHTWWSAEDLTSLSVQELFSRLTRCLDELERVGAWETACVILDDPRLATRVAELNSLLRSRLGRARGPLRAAPARWVERMILGAPPPWSVWCQEISIPTRELTPGELEALLTALHPRQLFTLSILNGRRGDELARHLLETRHLASLRALTLRARGLSARGREQLTSQLGARLEELSLVTLPDVEGAEGSLTAQPPTGDVSAAREEGLTSTRTIRRPADEGPRGETPRAPTRDVSQLFTLMDELLDGLSELDRALLLAHHREGRPLDEIAAPSALPTRRVRQRLEKIYASARDAYGDALLRFFDHLAEWELSSVEELSLGDDRWLFHLAIEISGVALGAYIDGAGDDADDQPQGAPPPTPTPAPKEVEEVRAHEPATSGEEQAAWKFLTMMAGNRSTNSSRIGATSEVHERDDTPPTQREVTTHSAPIAKGIARDDQLAHEQDARTLSAIFCTLSPLEYLTVRRYARREHGAPPQRVEVLLNRLKAQHGERLRQLLEPLVSELELTPELNIARAHELIADTPAPWEINLALLLLGHPARVHADARSNQPATVTPPADEAPQTTRAHSGGPDEPDEKTRATSPREPGRPSPAVEEPGDVAPINHEAPSAPAPAPTRGDGAPPDRGVSVSEVQPHPEAAPLNPQRASEVDVALTTSPRSEDLEALRAELFQAVGLLLEEEGPSKIAWFRARAALRDFFTAEGTLGEVQDEELLAMIRRWGAPLRTPHSSWLDLEEGPRRALFTLTGALKISSLHQLELLSESLREGELKSLEHLDVSGAELTTEGYLEHLSEAPLPALRTLDLSDNSLTDAAARQLSARRDLPALERLELSGNQLTSAGALALIQPSGLPSLEHLTLELRVGRAPAPDELEPAGVEAPREPSEVSARAAPPDAPPRDGVSARRSSSASPEVSAEVVSKLQRELAHLLHFPPRPKLWEELCAIIDELLVMGALNSNRAWLEQALTKWPDELRVTPAFWARAFTRGRFDWLWVVRELALSSLELSRAAAATLQREEHLGHLRGATLSQVMFTPGTLGTLLDAAPTLERLSLLAPAITHGELKAALSVERHAKLKRLEIAAAPLQDSGLRATLRAAGEHLEHLKLRDCELSEDALMLLSPHTPQASHATTLTHLTLDDSPVSASAYGHLQRSSQALSLEHLALRNAGLGPDALSRSGWRGLRSLDLSSNFFGDEGATALAGATSFEALDALNLSRNRISAEGIYELTRGVIFDGLSHLDLSYNPLGSRGARYLADCPLLMELKSLTMRGCKVGRDGEEVLKRSYYLRHVAVEF